MIPVLAEQSDPFFAPADLLVTTPTPSIEILAQENLLQKHKERVKRLPQQDRLFKICTDAGFLKQLKSDSTDEFVQFAEPVTCREYILARHEKSTDPKGLIRETPTLDPYWKSQPVACKVTMEWKSELTL